MKRAFGRREPEVDRFAANGLEGGPAERPVVGRPDDDSHVYSARRERTNHSLRPREGAQQANAQATERFAPHELVLDPRALNLGAGMVGT